MSGFEVSSIDGFQRRKADIIVFATVRCYAPSNLDFLNDMRRLNVVITRAKCGVAIIGNTATLSGGAGAEHELDESETNWNRLAGKRLCQNAMLLKGVRLQVVEIEAEAPQAGARAG
jgi:hypothetical protein